METEYEDNYWAEDALFMERNSRDFVSRIARINVNAEAICNILQASKYGQYSGIYLLDFANPSYSERGVLSQIQPNEAFLRRVS